MSGAPPVAIIVLNWNGWPDTRECLDSLSMLTYPNFRVYVVDNGSSDGSPDRIRRKFPQAHLVPLPENRGFAGGMNAGIRKGLSEGCRYLLCLNNDMTVESDLLNHLVAAAEDQTGVVPYPAIYQHGDPERLDNVGNVFSLYTGLTRMIAHGDRDFPARIEGDYTELPLLPRDLLITLGGWKEDYFAYYEDVDLSLRIRQAGWGLRCVPHARVYHKRGRTATRVHGLVSYYSLRNRLLVVRRHGSPWHYATTLLHVFLLSLPYLGLRCLLSPGYKHSFRHILQGLADGLLPGRRTRAPRWTMGPRPTPSRAKGVHGPSTPRRRHRTSGRDSGPPRAPLDSVNRPVHVPHEVGWPFPGSWWTGRKDRVDRSRSP